MKRSDEIPQVSVYFGISTVENGEATFEEVCVDQEMYMRRWHPGRERVNGGDHRLAIFCGYRWSCSCKAFR